MTQQKSPRLSAALKKEVKQLSAELTTTTPERKGLADRLNMLRKKYGYRAKWRAERNDGFTSKSRVRTLMYKHTQKIKISVFGQRFFLDCNL